MPSSWEDRGKSDSRYQTKRWKAVRARVLRSKVCALCGHSNPPAGSADHDPPVEMHTSDEQFFDLSGLRPMHGTKSKCTVCAFASGYVIKGDCQSIKGALEMGQAKARLKRRTGLDYGELPGSAPKAELTTNSTASNWPYPTINAAIRAFEYPAYSGQLAAEDLAEMWNNSGQMGCDCGEASGDRCFICLPLPFKEFAEED